MSSNVDTPKTYPGNYYLKILQSSLNLLAHILIGAIVGISLIFSFINVPTGATQQHIILCVIGYQLLMSQAILSLSASNGWSSNLRFLDKRRAHLVLQIIGSALAVTGSIIKINNKLTHWNTLHGRFGLVAMIFTAVSLVNGLTSFFAYEWRKFLPGNVTKILHICSGIVAYSASCICICYGFDKTFFKSWATEPVANAAIAFTAIFSFIIIIDPLITIYGKTSRLIKK